MKKLLLMLFLTIIVTTTIHAQIELKGIKINEVNEFEGTKSLAGIDFNLKTFNLADGNCAGLSGKPESPVTREELRNLILALSKHYNIKMKFWVTSDDLIDGVYHATIGRGKDKVIIRVDCFQSPEIKPNYTIVLLVVNNQQYSKYWANKDVEL